MEVESKQKSKEGLISSLETQNIERHLLRKSDGEERTRRRTNKRGARPSDLVLFGSSHAHKTKQDKTRTVSRLRAPGITQICPIYLQQQREKLCTVGPWSDCSPLALERYSWKCHCVYDIVQSTCCFRMIISTNNQCSTNPQLQLQALSLVFTAIARPC